MLKNLLEVKLKVKRDDCKLTNFLYKKGINANLKNLNVGIDYSNHLLELDKIDRKTLDEFRSNNFSFVMAGRNEIWIESESCSSCRILARNNIFILGTEMADPNTVIYRILVSSNQKLNLLLGEFKSDGIDAEIIKKEIHKPVSSLTKRQLEVLLYAYRKGYFDVERKTTLTQLSNSLGVKTSMLEYILRRALKKVVEYYLFGKV